MSRQSRSFCAARATNSKPSISGIIRSSRIRSGPRSASRSSATRPFSASIDRPARPAPASARIISRVAGSSSTTRTRLAGRARGDTSQHRRQPVAVDRLGQVVRRAEGVAQVLVVDIVTMTTGMSARSGSALSAVEHRPAVHARHHHVERDRVRVQLARASSQPFLAAGRADDAEAFLVQKSRDQVADRRVVVDDQDRSLRDAPRDSVAA